MYTIQLNYSIELDISNEVLQQQLDMADHFIVACGEVFFHLKQHSFRSPPSYESSQRTFLHH